MDVMDLDRYDDAVMALTNWKFWGARDLGARAYVCHDGFVLVLVDFKLLLTLSPKTRVAFRNQPQFHRT